MSHCCFSHHGDEGGRRSAGGQRRQDGRTDGIGIGATTKLLATRCMCAAAVAVAMAVIVLVSFRFLFAASTGPSPSAVLPFQFLSFLLMLTAFVGSFRWLSSLFGTAFIVYATVSSFRCSLAPSFHSAASLLPGYSYPLRRIFLPIYHRFRSLVCVFEEVFALYLTATSIFVVISNCFNDFWQGAD